MNASKLGRSLAIAYVGITCVVWVGVRIYCAFNNECLVLFLPLLFLMPWLFIIGSIPIIDDLTYTVVSLLVCILLNVILLYHAGRYIERALVKVRKYQAGKRKPSDANPPSELYRHPSSKPN
jgi:hypothetical protein